MALFQAIFSANAAIALVGSVILCLLLVSFRHVAVDRRISQAGGQRAPILACSLFSASRLYSKVAISHFQDRFSETCSCLLDDLPPSPTGALQHFGEFSLTGSKRVLITREPEQIKSILATKFHSFGHGPQWHELWRPFLGDGIFATDGQQWHHSRAMIRPMFVKDRVRNLDIFDACTEKLLGLLPASGVTVDLKDFFYRWTLDTSTDFLLGENVNSLENPNHDIARAMYTAQRIQMFIFLLNPIAPFIPKGEYHRAIRQIEEFINPIIDRAIKLPASELDELSKSDEHFTFLHSIAQSSKDPKLIRDQVISVLLAGRDTTAATMSWVIYEMSNYPETWSKLRKEVLSVLGSHGTPTYETLKDMKYVKNILNEVLRLHPAVPVNMRQALETTTIPGKPGESDIALLKGDTVTLNTIGMHLRQDLYPPISETFADPAIFSPERWESWTPKPWTYTPFHGGSRICVGQNFALTEMAFCLVRFAQKYERIEYRGDWAAQTLQADIIGTPGKGVPVALFEAKQR